MKKRRSDVLIDYYVAKNNYNSLIRHGRQTTDAENVEKDLNDFRIYKNGKNYNDIIVTKYEEVFGIIS